MSHFFFGDSRTGSQKSIMFASQRLGQRSCSFPNRTIHVAGTLSFMRRRLPLNSLWNWNAITYWGQVLNINRKGQIHDFFFFLLCFCSVFAGRINYPKHTIILNWNTQIRQFSESFRSFFQKLIVALKDWSFLMSINNYKDPKKIN